MALTDLPAPFLLEVRTERFVDLMLAIEHARFTIVSRPDQPNRYVVRDQACCPTGAGLGFVGTPCEQCRAQE